MNHTTHNQNNNTQGEHDVREWYRGLWASQRKKKNYIKQKIHKPIRNRLNKNTIYKSTRRK